MNPGLWFSVTDPIQFAVLIPVGVLWGYFSHLIGIDPSRRALMFAETVGLIWVFLLLVRAMIGKVAWEPSIGTALLFQAFGVAMWLGLKLRALR